MRNSDQLTIVKTRPTLLLLHSIHLSILEVEKQMGQILEEHAAYHLERSTIISKLMSNGEILDYS